MSRRVKKPGLQVEGLEPRLLMAGDVTAFISDGNLVILGDQMDNEIKITQVDGEYVVEGMNGTMVNGNTSDALSGMVDNIKVKTRNGDDHVVVGETGSPLTVSGTLRIQTGKGNDWVEVRESHVTGDLDVRTHQGNDVVRVENSDVDGRLRVRTHRGADEVHVLDSVIAEHLLVRTGHHDDIVEIGDVNGLVDVGDRLVLRTGHGDDEVNMHYAQAGELRVSLHHGDDTLLISQTTVKNDCNLDGGRGVDVFTDYGDNTFGAPPKERRF